MENLPIIEEMWNIGRKIAKENLPIIEELRNIGR